MIQNLREKHGDVPRASAKTCGFVLINGSPNNWQIYPLVIKHYIKEHPPFIVDFPSYKQTSMASSGILQLAMLGMWRFQMFRPICIGAALKQGHSGAGHHIKMTCSFGCSFTQKSINNMLKQVSFCWVNCNVV